MNNDSWLARWQQKQIGFHEATPHPLLVDCLPVLKLAADSIVFVPLCGASVDMYYLFVHGYQVIGCELSDIACRQFFTEHHLAYTVESVATFQCYQSENIKIFCGDMFQLTSTIIGKINAIYDRAALIALAVNQRQAYIQKLSELLPSLNMLLVSLTHDSDGGPPYSIDDKTLHQLFPDQMIDQLVTLTDTPTIKRLQANGKSDVCEYAYHIYKKANA